MIAFGRLRVPVAVEELRVEGFKGTENKLDLMLK